jgi:hypothetical protein
VTGFLTHIASWSFCSSILDLVAHYSGIFLSLTRDTGSYILDTAKGNLSERAFRFCTLYGSLVALDVLLILVCLCILFKIKRARTRIFYLRESYRFYIIFGALRSIVLFQSPLTLASILWKFGGLAGKYAAVAALLEISTYILICCVSHFVFTELYAGAKRVSVEKEKTTPGKK